MLSLKIGAAASSAQHIAEHSMPLVANVNWIRFLQIMATTPQWIPSARITRRNPV
jgi:hypothetical protein